jgi:hypothetical protein
MPFYLLLAMQASGMIIDFLGASNQRDMMNIGMKLQDQAVEANIMDLRAESADESLQSMKQLRQNLGSQIAANAAQGKQSGAGSAFAISNQSIGNFNADEQIRKLNLLGKENQLRAGQAMSRLQHSSDSTKLWRSFASRTINRFPSSVSGWEAFGKQAGQGFGLTSIGGGS